MIYDLTVKCTNKIKLEIRILFLQITDAQNKDYINKG